MKVGIITFHFANNFGGALQAYALRHFLETRLGAEARIIDYRHWFIRMTDFIRTFPVTSYAPCFLPWFGTIAERKRRTVKFRKFMEQEGHLTRCFLREGELKSIGSDFDMYICGSDQIWNPVITFGPVGAYYLDFAGEGRRRISYAVSTGGAGTHREKMIRLMRGLDSISIREEVGWVEEVFPGKVQLHMDPVFLLDRAEWEEIATPPAQKGKYILSYMMQQDYAAYYQVVEKLKQRLGCKVYDISRYGYRPTCVDEALVDVGPREFLGLFQSADHVCTNSFHGLAFALIFGKAVSFIPMKRFSSRIDGLCRLLGLSMEPAEDGAYFEVKFVERDLQEKISFERSRSLEYFRKNMELV